MSYQFWIEDDDAILHSTYVDGGPMAVREALAEAGRPDRSAVAIRQRAQTLGLRRYGHERNALVTVRMRNETLALLDAARGNVSRSAFIARVLRERLDAPSPY